MDNTDPLRLRFDLFELDEQQARLSRNGRALALAPKPFAVLCTLARRPGQLVSKSALLDAVWGHQYVSDSVLKTTISDLRALLGDDARQPRYIETASRRGYRFIATVQSAGGAPLNEAAPLDAAPAVAADGPMIGRAAARERLQAAWRAADAGRRQIVWVVGEAGVGKTTLIEHAIGELAPQVVARGQCVEQHGAGEPYLPVLDALAALCRDDPALTELLRSTAPTWLLQLPWLSSAAELETLRQQLAGTGQQRMLRELGELLDRYTQHRPLLLVTEDLHWSDQATLQLIDHMARRRGPARLLWLASFRLAEVIAEEHPLKALRHELRLHGLAEELLLEPFSEREVAAYVARRFPAQPVSEAQVRALHARTDGLPLFVVNLVDEVVAQEMSAGAQDAWDEGRHGGGPVPESLAGVIERQIARLAPEQRALLEAASVCGVEFRSGTLADALGREPAWAGERCDELAQRTHWLNGLGVERLPDGTIEVRCVFRHALYRQVFYQRIGDLARAQLHRRVAESMTRRRAVGLPVAAAELALQFELGHDPAAALRHYAEAAESALRHFAPGETMMLTSHALGLLPACPDGPERLALEMALLGPRSVAASHLLGITAPDTRSAYERLDQLCELLPDQASRALEMGLGWVLYVCGEYDQALAQARRKLALAERRGDPVLQVAASNLSGATLVYQGRLVEGRHWLERGLAAAAGLHERLTRALTVVDLEVSMRSRMGQVLAHLGAVDQARAQIAAAHTRADQLGQPYARRLVLIFECFLEARLDQPQRVLALAEALQRVATDHGITQADGGSRWLRGWALARLGDPEAGHRLIVEGYALDARVGMLRGRSGVLGYAAQALILARRWPDAQAQLDEAMALAARMGERIHLPDLLLLQAQLARSQGDSTRERAALQATQREAVEQQALWLQLTALVALCEMADASAQDRDALASVRATLHEGGDTALVQQADRLLR